MIQGFQGNDVLFDRSDHRVRLESRFIRVPFDSVAFDSSRPFDFFAFSSRKMYIPPAYRIPMVLIFKTARDFLTIKN